MKIFTLFFFTRKKDKKKSFISNVANRAVITFMPDKLRHPEEPAAHTKHTALQTYLLLW